MAGLNSFTAIVAYTTDAGAELGMLTAAPMHRGLETTLGEVGIGFMIPPDVGPGMALTQWRPLAGRDSLASILSRIARIDDMGQRTEVGADLHCQRNLHDVLHSGSQFDFSIFNNAAALARID